MILSEDTLLATWKFSLTWWLVEKLRVNASLTKKELEALFELEGHSKRSRFHRARVSAARKIVAQEILGSQQYRKGKPVAKLQQDLPFDKSLPERVERLERMESMWSALFKALLDLAHELA